MWWAFFWYHIVKGHLNIWRNVWNSGETLVWFHVFQTLSNKWYKREKLKCVSHYWVLWCLWWSSCVRTRAAEASPPETPRSPRNRHSTTPQKLPHHDTKEENHHNVIQSSTRSHRNCHSTRRCHKNNRITTMSANLPAPEFGHQSITKVIQHKKTNNLAL